MEKTKTSYSPNIIRTGTIIKRCAIYVRCSKEEAKIEGYSPEIQEEGIKNFIKNNGFTYKEKHIYKDIGESGGTDKRPELERMLTDAKNNEFDLVLVLRLDRFFRKLRFLENTLTDLLNSGVGVKSLLEPWADYSNPSSKLNLQILGAVAEWQREITLGSRNEGMIRAMKEGKYLGGTPPYGCKFNKEKQKLEIEKDEIKVVVMMFEWLVNEKLSEYKIQQRLNTMKVPTKFDLNGRKKKTGSKCWWNRKTVDRILTNEVYTGTFYYRKYIHPGRTKNEKNLRPKEDWIKVEDKSLQVVSQEIFGKGQKQLKKNKELSIRNTKEIYALQHKIVCGLDGYKFQCAIRRYELTKTGSRRETKYYYCVGTRKELTAKLCSASTVTESRIIPPVWEKLKELLENPELVAEQIETHNKGNCHNEEQLENIKKSLVSLEAKKERYAELYGEGSINKTFYNEKMQECDNQIDDLKKEEAKITQFLISDEEKGLRVRSLESLHAQLKDEIKSATYESKRFLMQKLVEKVVKTKNRLDIEFNFPILEKATLSPVFADCGDNPRMDRVV